jgi:hypothetical protein
LSEWHNWESGDSVGIRNWPHGPRLEQHEVLRRVAAAFRRVVIDWTEGDRWAEARISKAAEVYSGFLLEAEQALQGTSVLVSVADAGGPDAAWVRFYMTPDTESFELHYEPPGAEAACRALARKLAEVLGYEFAAYEDSLVEQESPVSDFLLHRDFWPNAEGGLPPAKGCLPNEELLRRVANRFPLAVIDRERGDRIVREGADKLAALHGSPTDPAVERQLALVGRVAHVTIRDAVGGPQFGFFLTPNTTGIHIEYERPQDREACRPLLKALVAELADYHHMNQDLDTETKNLDG